MIGWICTASSQEETYWYILMCISKYYSGNYLVLIPLGQNKVSLLEGYPHFRGQNVCKNHIWELIREGVHNSEVSFTRCFTALLLS